MGLATKSLNRSSGLLVQYLWFMILISMDDKVCFLQNLARVEDRVALSYLARIGLGKRDPNRK